MNLCSYGHEEVCYEGRDCPMCDKNEEIKGLVSEIEDLKNKIEELEGEE